MPELHMHVKTMIHRQDAWHLFSNAVQLTLLHRINLVERLHTDDDVRKHAF
jgi:hypothetical protein